ncbi:MBOAT_2 domain-containing protein [Pseudozyma hubeiensis]|nr:MBOAT_2 domain-containing protein [Pseudozyma hubeiensis]
MSTHTAHATHHLFVPSPNARALPIWAAVVPPLTYYLALYLLPPLSSKSFSRSIRSIASVTRTVLAAVSLYTFASLPFKYYYPGSAVLTYQLGLVGFYGASRVLDIFFLSYPRIPHRIFIAPAAKGPQGQGPNIVHPYTSARNEEWKTEPLPKELVSFKRAWWALDLMISMRGIGWDFASADVRHDSHPWQPPSSAQLRRACFKLLPILVGCTWIIHHMHPKHMSTVNPSILDLDPARRILFVAATGISLYTLFDFGYTLTSAVALPILHDAAEPASHLRSKAADKVLDVKGDRVKQLRNGKQVGEESELETDNEDESPAALQARALQHEQLSLRNIDFFPLLNPAGFTKATTVRRFWSYAWHRLFGRPFGVYGILPFTYVAYLIQDVLEGKFNDPKRKQARREIWPSYHPDPMRALERGRADWAKVLGAFTASGIIHAVSERAALGGRIAVPVTSIWLSRDHAKGMGHELRNPSIAGTGIFKFSPLQVVPPISGAGEFSFFFLNGVAVVVEGAIAKYVEKQRKRRSKDGKYYSMWYDQYISIAWTLSVLLFTGQAFVEGWIRSGISKEIGLVMS